jgi:hypothetical protein
VSTQHSRVVVPGPSVSTAAWSDPLPRPVRAELEELLARALASWLRKSRISRVYGPVTDVPPTGTKTS